MAIDPEPILTASRSAHSGLQGDLSGTLATKAKPGACVRVTSDGLRLRKQAGTSAPIIHEMQAGTMLRVLSKPQTADGYTWAEVRTRDGVRGWAAMEFCAGTSTDACRFLAGDRISITDTDVRFRQKAGLSSTILRAFALDERICVTGDPTTIDGYTWHPVRSETGEQGWVAGDFCSLVEAGGCADLRTTTVTRPGWPTAAAIDERIAMSNRANGRTSKLTGKGARFIELGKRYGINPAIVVAIAQRECQLGADGSHLSEHFNNFGGITAGPSGEYPGPCGAKHFGDRFWKVYCSPDEGLEGLFRLLDTPLYRNTGGRFEKIMSLYSPAFENPWDGPGSIWETFRAVGQQLRVSITRDTNVYA